MDDLEAIRQLKARYFRFVDTKDWDGLRDVFTDDALIDLSQPGGDDAYVQMHGHARGDAVIDGADAFVSLVRNGLGKVRSVHHGHMPEIQMSSPTTATGIWAMEDLVEWPEGMTLHGYGHYHETYEKVADTWRITSMRLTRLRVDVTMPDRPTAGPVTAPSS